MEGMASLFDEIRIAVREERYVVGVHANERLRERRIMGWQVIDGIDGGELLAERPDSEPHPTVELRQVLADGSAVKVVWAWMARDRVAKLVTVYTVD